MNTALRMFSACLVAAGLSACDQHEGPAEQMGEKIDHAVEQTREQLKDSADAAGEKIEEAGDRLREKTDQ